MRKRPGRPRKMGERYPGGELKRPTEEALSPKWQRVIQNWRGDPRALTELGRLNWHGKPSDTQTVAAFRIVEIYGRYEGIKGLRRKVFSPAYAIAYSEARTCEDSSTQQRAAGRKKFEHESIKQFSQLQTAMAELPALVRKAIEELCVEDKFVGPQYHKEILSFLQRMSLEWKITPGPKPKKVRKPSKQQPLSANPMFFMREDEISRELEEETELQAFHEAKRTLCPDMKPKQVKESYDQFKALKDREEYRHERNLSEPDEHIELFAEHDRPGQS